MDSVSSIPRKPIRLWPGVAAAVLLILVRFGLPVVWPEGAVFGVIGAVLAGLLIVAWWLFFSRAPWPERLGAVGLMAVAIAATSLVVHPSISNGMMGMLLPIFAIPLLGVALVAAAAASRHLSTGARRTSIAVAMLLACGLTTMVRTGGVTGGGTSEFHWRWTPTPEERLLATAADAPIDPASGKPMDPAPAAAPAPPSVPPTAKPSAPGAAMPDDKPAPAPASAAAATDPVPAAARIEWPGFRGPARDGVVRGVHLETDWATSPPVELWRRPIGPGWSSFAVRGDAIYTQEQRGDDEVVSCYRLSTGEPVWQHRDAVRFWESNGGAGPRGTPTVHDGRVYTVGATGIVNALDAGSGAVVWSSNGATDAATEIPEWGFASSPLVINDLVIVALSGQLVAYDLRTGNRRWIGPTGGAGYSSPHLVTIDGVPQILLLRGSRTVSVSPADGTLLWEHSWAPGVGIVQPAMVTEHDVILTTGDAMGGVGMRRIAVARNASRSGSGQASGWTVEERWTSRGLKPYFNDFVVHEGHAYGFDASILASVGLEDGTRKWKGGRYGHGQLVLLPDQDLLLVLSEEGGLALVSATPDKFTEIARFPAIEGKTWNHPVLVGAVLLVRNDQEMAAFRLPTGDR